MAMTQKMRNGVFVLGALVLGLAAGALTIYGMGGFSGNGQFKNAEAETASAAACALSDATKAALNQAASGDVAALRIADAPKQISKITFQDAEGKQLSIADWKDKVLLLNLWATWCGPCREEMPDLAKLQDAYKSDNFEVLALNVDRNGGDKPGNFLKEISAEQLGLFLDPSNKSFQEFRKKGLVFGLPTTMIVDTNGCVQGVLSGIAHWWSDDARNLIDVAVRELKG